MAALRAAAAAILLSASALAQTFWDVPSIQAQVDELNGGIISANDYLRSSDPNRASLFLDTVQEVDLTGVPVGSNDGPHALVRRRATVTAWGQDAAVGGIPAAKSGFRMAVGPLDYPTGIATMDAFVLKGAGRVGPPLAPWIGAAGDVKLNIGLSAWNWCGCSLNGVDQVGAFVDVAIRVQGRNAGLQTLGSAWSYDLGGGVRLEVTNQVTLDGIPTLMPPGYPRVEQRVAGQVIMLRFPSFEDGAVFEALLRISGSDTAKVRSTPAPGVWSDAAGGNVSLKAALRGGNISASATALGDADRYRVVLAAAALREVDVSGQSVGVSAWSMSNHSVAAFAAQDFAITRGVQPVQIGSAFGNRVNLSTPVGQVGVLAVDAVVLTQAGSVGPSGLTWYGAPGDVRWSVGLSNWAWCGCPDGTGAYVDIDLVVQGSDQPYLADQSRGTWALGGGILLELPASVELDGVDVPMPAGYPKLQTRPGGAQVVVVRVPQFQRTGVYKALLRTSASASLIGGKWTGPIYVSRGARGDGASAALGLALLAGVAALPM